MERLGDLESKSSKACLFQTKYITDIVMEGDLTVREYQNDTLRQAI